MVEQEIIDCVNDIVKKVVKRDTDRRYREKNKEKIRQKDKVYREKNKDKRKEYLKKNKEKTKRYNQTPQAIKSMRISQWKYRGIICDNWDALYNHYLKTSYCDICKVKLTCDKVSTATTKCCDHDHSIIARPNFRNILCHSCNVRVK